MKKVFNVLMVMMVMVFIVMIKMDRTILIGSFNYLNDLMNGLGYTMFLPLIYVINKLNFYKK